MLESSSRRKVIIKSDVVAINRAEETERLKK
jgi:hypothetical protein